VAPRIRAARLGGSSHPRRAPWWQLASALRAVVAARIPTWLVSV
jgi:hypothetical protein